MDKQAIIVRLPGQHDGETTLLFLRRHWFVFFLNALMFLVLTLLPLIIFAIVPEAVASLFKVGIWNGLLTMFMVTYYLLMWLFFFAALIDYYLDIWIVTDKCIIDIQQLGLFKHVVAEQKLIKIQDITTTVKGIFPTFLNYGDVNIQTAGEEERFVFQQVPNPEEVRKVIMKAYEEAIRKEGYVVDPTKMNEDKFASSLTGHLHP